jgi:hypothetical protein
MIFAPHTFELTLTLDSKKFKKTKDQAYKNSKGKHRVFLERSGVHKDTCLAGKGLKIEYHDGTYKKKIKFIANPTALLGGNDVKKLWKPNNKNISKLLHKLDMHIDEYFESKYMLEDFKLTRMDFTVNINVGDSKKVPAYIKVLRRIGKVKGFSPKYDDASDIIKDNSFDLEGNSNDIEFSAYDKWAQLKEKDDIRAKHAEGILRVEVRLMKQKAIRKHTKETATPKQIKSLSANSKNIFLAIFTRIVPLGDHYKKKETVSIVKKNVSKKVPREKMLRLIDLIPQKKSLYLALKEMDDRNIDKVTDRFAELGVSPVTISKRMDIDHLKSLYEYF